MDTFSRALAFVLAHEGGYTDDPRDPGGETNFGICKRVYPDLDIKALTRDAAEVIYQRDYWHAARCGGMPPAVAVMHFDCTVNQGPTAAAKMLQVAAGVTPDGVIGPKTLAAVRAADTRKLVTEYAARRAMRYASTNGVNVFGLGWMRRLTACLALALDMEGGAD